MRLELITAYAVSVARVASWAIAMSLVYHRSGLNAMSALALARGTLGLVNYGMLGFATAIISIHSKPLPAIPVNAADRASTSILDYETKRSKLPATHEEYVQIAVTLSMLLCVPLIVLVFNYEAYFSSLHDIAPRPYQENMIIGLGLGFIFRSISDVYGSVLQYRSKITIDNLLMLFAELVFILWLFAGDGQPSEVGRSFLISSILLFGVRSFVSGYVTLSFARIFSKFTIILLVAGLWVTLGQLSDWFYAPVNNIILARFDDIKSVAFYSPAVQLDGALLLLVGGLSAVLFPKSAIAFSSGKIDTIRNYFIKGTLASLLLLTCGAVVISLYGKWIMTKWFGTSFPITEAILPLVMIHTVIGGASSVGRSILMGIGKLKVYAISSIIGGLCNAILAAIAVGVFHWGLKGIIFVTIFTVTIRCAIWMPWYVLHTLKHEQGKLNIGSINDQGTAGSI